MHGYVALLRANPAYRRLWLGEVVSFLGDWFSTIALFTIVERLTDSALALAGVMIGKTLPSLLVVPIAGPLADRMDRRRLMIATDLVRAACVAGLIAANHLDSLPLLYVCLVLMVAFTGIFVPARTAATPMVTTREELPVAMALSGGTWSAMLALGAALGGLVTELVGVDGSLVLDAGTYLLSAVLLAGLPPLPPEPTAERSTGFVEGLGYLRQTPYVLALSGLKSVASLGAGILVALPVYGLGVFPERGPFWVGFLSGMRGFGALIGAMGMRSLTGDSPDALRRSILPGLMLLAVGAVIGALGPGIGWVGCGFLIAGIGQSLVWVFSNTLLQYAVHPAYRGRVFSLEFGVATLTISLASLVAGALMDGLGWSADAVMWVSALAVVVVGGPWSAWVVASGRAAEAVEPAPAR